MFHLPCRIYVSTIHLQVRCSFNGSTQADFFNCTGSRVWGEEHPWRGGANGRVGEGLHYFPFLLHEMITILFPHGLLINEFVWGEVRLVVCWRVEYCLVCLDYLNGSGGLGGLDSLDGLDCMDGLDGLGGLSGLNSLNGLDSWGRLG